MCSHSSEDLVFFFFLRVTPVRIEFSDLTAYVIGKTGSRPRFHILGRTDFTKICDQP